MDDKSVNVGHIECTPSIRSNPFMVGGRKWAACEAVNQLNGEFSEADVLPVFVGVCHSHRLRPGSAERTIRGAVTEMVKRRVLLRQGRKKLSHVQ